MIKSKVLVYLFFLLLIPVRPVYMQEDTEPPGATPTSEAVNRIEGLIEADFVASTHTPLVGEPVELTLVVDIPSGLRIMEWPEFNEDWPPFMVVRAGEVQITEQADGSATHQQILDVRLWRPGDFRTPDTFITYDVLATGKVHHIPVRTAFFSVPSVLETEDLNALTLRPDAPPIWLFYIPPFIIALLLASFAGGGWIGRKWWEKRRLERTTQLAVNIPKSPGEVALAELRQLKSTDLLPTEVYAATSDTMRSYIQQRFDIPAQDMTTVELIALIQDGNYLEKPQISDLQRILEQADLVKFAGLQPGQQSTGRVLSAAYRWLSSVEQQEVENDVEIA